MTLVDHNLSNHCNLPELQQIVPATSSPNAMTPFESSLACLICLNIESESCGESWETSTK